MKRLYMSGSEEKCPYQCIYCFTESEDYKKGVKHNKKEAVSEIAKECEIIQPACDAELLLEKNWKDRLAELVPFHKNISFATKKRVTPGEVAYLSKINNQLKKVGKILNVGVTICKYNHYKEIELNAPSPEERIEGLKLMYEAGIGCNIIIRPLFPDCELSDLKSIIDKTKNYTYGYLLGPLYLNDAVREYFHKNNISNIKIEPKKPDWNQNNQIDVVYSTELSNEIKKYISQAGSMAFDNNADCVKAIERILIYQNMEVLERD